MRRLEGNGALVIGGARGIGEAIAGCTIVAAVDTNAERARDFSEAYGIPFAFLNRDTIGANVAGANTVPKYLHLAANGIVQRRIQKTVVPRPGVR